MCIFTVKKNINYISTRFWVFFFCERGPQIARLTKIKMLKYTNLLSWLLQSGQSA